MAFFRLWFHTSLTRWGQKRQGFSSGHRWCRAPCLRISSGWPCGGRPRTSRPACCPSGTWPAPLPTYGTTSAAPSPGLWWQQGWSPGRHPTVGEETKSVTNSLLVMFCDFYVSSSISKLQGWFRARMGKEKSACSPQNVHPHICRYAPHTGSSWSWQMSSPRTRRGRTPRCHSRPGHQRSKLCLIFKVNGIALMSVSLLWHLSQTTQTVIFLMSTLILPLYKVEFGLCTWAAGSFLAGLCNWSLASYRKRNQSPWRCPQWPVPSGTFQCGTFPDTPGSF